MSHFHYQEGLLYYVQSLHRIGMKHTLMKVYRGEGCPMWQLEEPRLDESMQVGRVLRIDTGVII